MKIEVVEFYPNKLELKKNYVGSLHVYLIDYGMDLRGIGVYRQKSRLFFELPYRKTLDENGDVVKFPYIGFPNMEKTKLFYNELKKIGTEYVNEYLKENEGK